MNEAIIYNDSNSDTSEKWSIFVGGLSKTTSLKDIMKFMKDISMGARYNVMTNQDNSCRGFAFIEFDTKEVAD